MTTLETRLLNILKKNPIDKHTTSGQYKAALTRLTKKGIARLTDRGWELSTKAMIS